MKSIASLSEKPKIKNGIMLGKFAICSLKQYVKKKVDKGNFIL